MSDWQDRRGMFQRGKEVHEPGRKMSGTGVVDAVRRASIGSNSDKAAEPTSTAAARRRSSGVAFENLTNLKRGSDDYGDRRASHHEMHNQGGGLVAGWFNKTFRGMQSTPEAPEVKPKVAKQDTKRGVMEWYERRTDSI